MSEDKIKIEMCSRCFMVYDINRIESCPSCDHMEPRKRCRDCGRFVKRHQWVEMTKEARKLNKAPLCSPCYSNYDDQMCY